MKHKLILTTQRHCYANKQNEQWKTNKNTNANKLSNTIHKKNTTSTINNNKLNKHEHMKQT